MSEKKLHKSVETILEKTDPALWSSSAEVSTTLLTCRRVAGMARNSIRKMGVSHIFADEVISDTAFIVQTKIICNGIGDGPGQIRQIVDIYTVIYRVIDLTVSNYRKKVTKTTHSPESSFSDEKLEDEDSDDSIIGRLSNNPIDHEFEDRMTTVIDMDLGKRKLQEKIARLGWPSDIYKERLQTGRPKKINA